MAKSRQTLVSVDDYMKGSTDERLRDGHALLNTGEVPGYGKGASALSKIDREIESFYLGDIAAPQLNALTQQQKDYNMIRAALDADYVVAADGPARYIPLRVFSNRQGTTGLDPAATLTQLEELVMEAQVSGTAIPEALGHYLQSGEMLSTNDALRESLEAEAGHAGNSKLLQDLAAKHPQTFVPDTAVIYQLPTRAQP